MTTRYLLFTVLLFAACTLHAQLRINEAVASNQSIRDEDGDSPDWLELHNPGNAVINLANYTLSDKPNNPGKWTIPSLDILPGDYTVFWASGKDQSATQTFRTFINQGDNFRYLVPSTAIDQDWVSLGFNDDNWQEGPSGFGYGDDDDNTQLPTGTISVFARKTFILNELDGLEQLIFDLDYDDGFVAYLNGVEIARANMSGTRPTWDAFADDYTEPLLINGTPPLRFVIEDPQDFLSEGENVLAIQVHNSGLLSSDLSLIPFLSGLFTRPSAAGISPPEVLDLVDQRMHTNFKISTGGETLVLYDPEGNFVDSLPVYNLPEGTSIGIPGNGGEVAFFQNQTPAERNPDRGFLGQVKEQVLFSMAAGQVEAFSLELSGVTAPNVIHYTTDGSEPTISSPGYTGPISVSQTQTVRAAAFRENYLPSAVETKTYFIGTNHDLPIVSLVTEPDNFFHPETGIYVLGEGYSGDFPYFGSNIWEDVEVPVHFTFHEPNGSDAYSFNAGTKIFGGWSRGQDQRSLSVFARGRYGTNELDYPFFQDHPFSTFQALVLRNSGNDLYSSGMRDVIMTGLMKDSDVDVQAFRTVTCYINGEYWGIYNLREKVNEHFIASKHGVDPDSIDLLEINATVVQGSNAEYLGLLDYARDNPIDQNTHYEYLAEHIDLDNYIQYQAAQIYYDNRDWPGNNIKYWKSPGTKWRWILYDTDFGAAIWNSEAAFTNTLNFALTANGPDWPNPPWSTFLFRRLMTNQTFRHRFINQLADEMNSRFLPQLIVDRINSHTDLIDEEISRHDMLWGRRGNWEENVDRIRNFFWARPNQMKGFVRNQFALPAHHTINIKISNSQEGYVMVNSLKIDEDDWNGDYFQNVPIKVTAVPKEGYQFLHWELDNSTEDSLLTINMTRNLALRPVFTEEAVSATEPGNGLISVTGIEVSPNPSDGVFRIRFTALKPAHLTANLYDLQGRQVNHLFDMDFGAGPQVQSLDVRALPSGTYWFNLREAGGGQAVVKWVKR